MEGTSTPRNELYFRDHQFLESGLEQLAEDLEVTLRAGVDLHTQVLEHFPRYFDQLTEIRDRYKSKKLDTFSPQENAGARVSQAALVSQVSSSPAAQGNSFKDTLDEPLAGNPQDEQATATSEDTSSSFFQSVQEEGSYWAKEGCKSNVLELCEPYEHLVQMELSQDYFADQTGPLSPHTGPKRRFESLSPLSSVASTTSWSSHHITSAGNAKHEESPMEEQSDTSRESKVAKHATPPKPSAGKPGPVGPQLMRPNGTASQRELNQVLESLCEEFNQGFGCVPVFNASTNQSRRCLPGDPDTPEEGTLVTLCCLEYSKGRRGLIQCNNYLSDEEGSSVSERLRVAGSKGEALRVVLYMDQGEDIATVVFVRTAFPFTPGYPEAPFMPIKRLASRDDLTLSIRRRDHDLLILAECRRILKEDCPLLRDKVEICGAEVQLDGSRVILFGLFSARIKWNLFNQRLRKFCERELNIRAFVWIQRKFIEC